MFIQTRACAMYASMYQGWVSALSNLFLPPGRQEVEDAPFCRQKLQFQKNWTIKYDITTDLSSTKLAQRVPAKNLLGFQEQRKWQKQLI